MGEWTRLVWKSSKGRKYVIRIDGSNMEKEVEQSPIELSEKEKRKYLFLKQVNTLNAFRERNAISKEQYDISYYGLVTKMKITDKELQEWLSANGSETFDL